MSKKNFYTLLNRYRSSQCTEREKRLVEQWFSLLDERVPERQPEANQQMEEKLWKAIQEKKQEPRKRWRLSFVNWKWAAAVLLLISLAISGAYEPESALNLPLKAVVERPEFIRDVASVKRESSFREGKSVLLSDGTEVWLSPNSAIEYPASFGESKREVFLRGKAFFKVVSDSEKPFLVYTDEIVTRVLGTSFWIDGNKSTKGVEVSVVTGKVTVSKRAQEHVDPSQPERGGVVLTANQKAKFSENTQHFELGIVDVPQPIQPEENVVSTEEQFVFEAAPIAEVIEKLEKTYGIEIVLENEGLKDCLFRGDIAKQPLFNKLDLLCSATNATYEIDGVRVLVRGEGCANPELKTD